jgi:peptidoglycan hydrolase-like protein with peptidoglycan-binding domain
MQALLIRAGTIADKPANHDGVFGPGLLKAVERFQAAHQLDVDGRCGPKTWQALGG